jgi:hypothetical protein
LHLLVLVLVLVQGQVRRLAQALVRAQGTVWVWLRAQVLLQVSLQGWSEQEPPFW